MSARDAKTARMLLGHRDFRDDLGVLMRDEAGADRAVRALLREFELVAPSVPTPDIPIWKTLRIGGKSKEQLIGEMEAAGVKIWDWAREMMAKEEFTTSSSPIDLPLVNVSVGDLGFVEERVSYKSLLRRAQELGLTLCPGEVGPHLRLADSGKRDVWFWVGMEPIVLSNDNPQAFKVGNDREGPQLTSTPVRVEEERSLLRWVDIVLVAPRRPV